MPGPLHSLSAGRYHGDGGDRQVRQKALPFGNASWYGTDLFVENSGTGWTRPAVIFLTSRRAWRIVSFFSKDADPKVLAHISFDSSYAVSSAKADHSIRKMNKTEKAHHALRQKALELIVSDTMFKVYGNSSLNLIPL